MAERPDYYALLGVAPDADDLTVKQAFRRLAGRYHPDRRGDDPEATARFQALMEAYGVVGDRERRLAYDAGRSPEGLRVEPGGRLEELLGRLVDQLFGMARRTAVRGRDRQYRLELALAEVALGSRRTLDLPTEAPCDACDGRGFPLQHIPEICPRCAGLGELQRRRALRSVVEACPDCDGRGFQLVVACPACEGAGARPTRQAVTIDVPAGVEEGARLRVRGGGEAGRHGGEPGDLYVVVAVQPHPVLRRDGDDLVMERPVTALQALAGDRLAVPTVEGTRWLRMPGPTRDGAVLRMAGLGVRRPDGARGDQRVTVRVELPAALDDEARDVLRSLGQRLGSGCFPVTGAFEERWAAGEDDEAG